MALVTVADYQDFVRKFFWAVDNEFGGVFANQLERAGIARADVTAAVTDYQTYKQNRQNAPAATPQYPTNPNTNRGIYRSGRGPTGWNTQEDTGPGTETTSTGR